MTGMHLMNIKDIISKVRSANSKPKTIDYTMYVHVYALLSFKLQIDIDVIQEISDNDLEKYLQCKGDRIAVKAFASEQKNKDTDNERKLALIDSLRKRMGVPNMSDTDDEETTIGKKRPYSFSRKFKKRKQAEIASKPDRAIVVGFAILDSSAKAYRQIRAPLGGGTRYARVNKNTRKNELIKIICPLFFPDGKNCHGNINDYSFDISTDVHGTQLMQNESIEEITRRLGLKHFRCYLMAKCQAEDFPDDENNQTEVTCSSSDKGFQIGSFTKTVTKKRNEIVKRNDIKDAQISKRQTEESSDTEESLPDLIHGKGFSLSESLENVSENQITPKFPEGLEKMPCNESKEGTLCSKIDLVKKTAMTQSASFSGFMDKDNNERNNDNVIVEYLPDLSSLPGSSSVDASRTAFLRGASIDYESDSSGVIQFGQISADSIELDETLPLVCKITVHRGRVARDLIDFFSQENIPSHSSTVFEINMLKEDGTPEAAEDNGGVMRDSLTEFWDTFYLQYTEGNTYKVPVLRHDMTDVQWKSVASVIRMGFYQEKVFPIKLAPSFMQQAIFGACTESDLIDSFLKYVSAMDRSVIESALKDFETVDKDEIYDALEQYDVKKAINAENIERIVREVAHKELVQKPMFIADCFYKVLNATILVQEDMSVLYSTLEPTPKKVLNSIKFPEQMSSEEKTLSQYLKKLVREMDDPQNLQLFLRFCTGSDIMTKSDIQIRFTSSNVSSNVRCPSSHTCGCVLEIPRSYSQDPYVLFKSDFLSLLRNRYWQMDFV